MMMQKQTITFEQLSILVLELSHKVDYLAALLAKPRVSIEEIGGVELAMQITRLSKARIYALVSGRTIPHKKRGNRLTFRRSELLEWLDKGNREQKGGQLI